MVSISCIQPSISASNGLRYLPLVILRRNNMHRIGVFTIEANYKGWHLHAGHYCCTRHLLALVTIISIMIIQQLTHTLMMDQRTDVHSLNLDQWPKSCIPSAFVAKIGYLSISVFATPPGRHRIGQRRPPPDDGHISAG